MILQNSKKEHIFGLIQKHFHECHGNSSHLKLGYALHVLKMRFSYQISDKRIVKLLTNVTEKQWKLPCKTEDQNIVTLEWLVTDYIDHMNHHFKQIFDE